MAWDRLCEIDAAHGLALGTGLFRDEFVAQNPSFRVRVRDRVRAWDRVRARVKVRVHL